MTKKKYFGTDGVRGKVGSALINPEFVLKLGWAVGHVFGNSHGGHALIGKDTRISGYMFESALEAGLSAAGLDTHLLGPMPTPAIAYLTRTLRADVGIVISASHNPYDDNGIKFFTPEGVKLGDDVELEIEKYIDSPMELVDNARLGKAKRVKEAAGRYIEFCKATIPYRMSLKGLKIVLDCADGATYYVAPLVFRELGAEVVELGVDPNGTNINEQCGATAPQRLQKIVKAEQADVGIAFDGDGDRVIMVDHLGEIVDGDELLFIVAQDCQQRQCLHGGVVGTIMSNFGLERSLQKAGIEFRRTDVGDRYVFSELNKLGWLLGGESSGHIVHLGLTTTGDGIISALQVLRAMLEVKASLNELKQAVEKCPQVLINVPIQAPIAIDHKDIQQAVVKAEKQLNGSGRVLIRASGTEPLIRVMTEGEESQLVSRLAQELADVVKMVRERG